MSPSEELPEPVFDADRIAARIDAMAGDIAQDLGGDPDNPKRPVGACILKGAYVFAADLARALMRRGVDIDLDFLRLASYGDATESSGRVRIVGDLETGVDGRDVLLIDDILDTGQTLLFARQLMESRGAASVRVAVLLDKSARRAVAQEADYVGFSCPDVFVVGYGMDHAGRWRGLPYIGNARG